MLRTVILPRPLRYTLLPSAPSRFFSTRHASRLTHGHPFGSFFTRPPPPARISYRSIALWLVPIAGGIGLYSLPRNQSPIHHDLFASPTIIPCSKRCSREPFIMSPAEPDATFLNRILSIIRDNIWEPILTVKRFLHLFCLFMPVILSAPMLVVGTPERRLQGDRWGAVWWYGFLVAQMERAGPTFIKVRASCGRTQVASVTPRTVGAMGSIPSGPIPFLTLPEIGQDALPWKATSTILYQEGH